MGLMVMIFPIAGFILTLFIVYWFYTLVKSIKQIAQSQVQIADSLSVISSKLLSDNSDKQGD